MLTTRINILKPIVLAGTFALAMAFAANDLVNFIGVPLASFHALMLAKTSATDPLTMSMAALQKSVTPTPFSCWRPGRSWWPPCGCRARRAP
jgi:hypothetical protein